MRLASRWRAASVELVPTSPPRHRSARWAWFVLGVALAAASLFAMTAPGGAQFVALPLALGSAIAGRAGMPTHTAPAPTAPH